MKRIVTSEKVYTDKSTIPNSGRGVFARCDIKKGELIERCPVIKVTRYDTSNLNESILVTYFFFVGRRKDQSVFALGFGSLYNHSYDPNATYKIKVREEVIDFIAINNIKKDSEITVNYNFGNPKDKTPLWFDVGKKY